MKITISRPYTTFQLFYRKQAVQSSYSSVQIGNKIFKF